MRRDDDEELAVCAELPEQGKQQRVVEQVHCVATHDDVESVFKSAFGNVLEPQLSARFSGAGTVAAGECHACGGATGGGAKRDRGWRLTLRA